MNDQPEQQRLEEVLDAFLASGPEPDGVSLDEWIRRYPEFARELTDFAASWTLMRDLPPAPDAQTLPEETLVLRGMSVVQNLLHEREQAKTAPVAITSLTEAGAALGLRPRQLAQAAGLGDALLGKLNRRLIRFASIPREAIEQLAATLQRDVESISAYLQQPSTFAAAAQHRAEQAPQLAEPEDFFDAVRADRTLVPPQRERWLALERSDGSR